MTSVANNTTSLYTASPTKSQATPVSNKGEATPTIKTEQSTVTLSSEGKALLSALQEIDKEEKAAKAANESVGDKVESFAHGALGMDHPDKIEEEDDGSYSAGQYLSAAVTIGGILLALA